MTDSHISIVLVPANIISAEGFISGRDGDGQGEGVGGGGGAEGEKKKKKQPSFFKSQVISVLWRVKLYRGRFFFFFISNKRFYALVNLVDVICT